MKNSVTMNFHCDRNIFRQHNKAHVSVATAIANVFRKKSAIATATLARALTALSMSWSFTLSWWNIWVSMSWKVRLQLTRERLRAPFSQQRKQSDGTSAKLAAEDLEYGIGLMNAMKVTVVCVLIGLHCKVRDSTNGCAVWLPSVHAVLASCLRVNCENCK